MYVSTYTYIRTHSQTHTQGAAYLGMGNCYDATVAFRAGLALDPGNAVMLEGLKEAESRSLNPKP
jgi:hypothetical protein